jgi:predicted nucleotide-binding protein (sugar kinase/HSP70/actin superfamily)
LLEKESKSDIETGLKYVNNDACCPAIKMIGQTINALQSNEYDVNKSAVYLTETGGVCRATNYSGFLRKALDASGFGQVPIVTNNPFRKPIQSQPGFSDLSIGGKSNVVRSIVIGDVLQTCLLRIRPYEQAAGGAQQIYDKWLEISKRWVRAVALKTPKETSYKNLIKNMAADFDAIKLKDIPRKPRVGIVGEILVRVNDAVNNNLIKTMENEGFEVIISNFAEYTPADLWTAEWNRDNLNDSNKAMLAQIAVRAYLEKLREPVKKAYKQAGGKFGHLFEMRQLTDYASEVVSLGVRCGEGWYLVGDIVNLLNEGIANIVCVQPFACLPSHIIGRGAFQKIRRLYPEANLVSLEYDPGSSEVNQNNRLKLMLEIGRTNYFNEMTSQNQAENMNNRSE